jgi:hypothetical protein
LFPHSAWSIRVSQKLEPAHNRAKINELGERSMEEFFDAVTGGAIWGVGFGLALSAVQALGGGMRPTAKGAVRGALGVGDWLRSVTAESRETLQDIYHEARAEVESGRGASEGAAEPEVATAT